MKCAEIIERLEREVPVSLAENWDNPGLQVGRREAEVKKIYLALDATDEVIQHCVQTSAELLITHHPLLMGGVKKINSDDFHGRKILNMIENHIAHYAMHTNYDVALMGKLCSEYLQMTELEPLEETGLNADGESIGIGTVGDLPREMSVRECCEHVKKAFSLEHVKVFGDLDRMVQRAALCPGSGKSLVNCALEKQAQVYITGDIGHHDGIDSVDQGLIIIDAGHYGVEHVFIAQMKEFLEKEFPELEVYTEPVQEPFLVI